jgi:hypothetical protein
MHRFYGKLQAQSRKGRTQMYTVKERAENVHEDPAWGWPSAWYNEKLEQYYIFLNAKPALKKGQCFQTKI